MNIEITVDDARLLREAIDVDTEVLTVHRNTTGDSFLGRALSDKIRALLDVRRKIVAEQLRSTFAGWPERKAQYDEAQANDPEAPIYWHPATHREPVNGYGYCMKHGIERCAHCGAMA
jgi:hypothetical protein